MEATVGIFKSRKEAELAFERVRLLGIPDKNISILSPDSSEKHLEAVATSDTEQPGMGKAMGGVVGGALGTAGGMSLGIAAASLMLPGVGPIIATGILGAAILGIGGAVSGAAVGEALEDAMADGLPKDEVFVYEDALRKGRTVLIALPDSEDQLEATRTVLHEAGAESVDAAREDWWVGLRDAEEEDYKARGGDFAADEPRYRRGFEAALHPETRGKSYAEAADHLNKCYGPDCKENSFRRGFDRGQEHFRRQK